MSSQSRCRRLRPRFAARVAAAPGGAGGMSRNIAATNVDSSSIANVLLNRRSNPIVEIGIATQRAAAHRARKRARQIGR